MYFFSVFTLSDVDGNVFIPSDVGMETREILVNYLGAFTLLDVDEKVFAPLMWVRKHVKLCFNCLIRGLVHSIHFWPLMIVAGSYVLLWRLIPYKSVQMISRVVSPYYICNYKHTSK